MKASIAIVLAGLLLVLTVGPVSAGEPVAGHKDYYTHALGDGRRTLDFHFNSLNYPAWFRTVAESELEVTWRSLAANNSNVPKYGNGGDNSGGGTIIYTSVGTSPCTGSPDWIGCNPASGLTAFQIYVRSFPSATAPTWLWWDRGQTCSDQYPSDGFRTSVCFSIKRVIAHESTHNTLTRSHNSLDDNESIMQGETPTPNGSPAYWNRPNFLPCDEAGAQLEYGLADPGDDYANCFATFPGDGVKGLNTSLTLSTGTTYTKCVNSGQTVRGRLALANDSAYEDMRNTPLEGRVVRIDRKPHGSTTWALAYSATASGAAGDNWSVVVNSGVAGTYDYRGRWLTKAEEPALNSSNEVVWTVTWTTRGCPTIAVTAE
jgi:hypothetical protein